MTNVGYPIKVRARLHATDKPIYKCWDFAINRKQEFSKLSRSDFPITVDVNKGGQAITLKNGAHKCNASVHRLEDETMWINSAKIRLNDPNETDSYANFLQTLGIVVGSTEKYIYVELEFVSKNIVNVSVYVDRAEFKRQLDELRNIISDGVAYFSAWQGLMVEDDESAQALNRYRGLFLPARNALMNTAIMQFVKVFDRNPRTISLRNLIIKAKGNKKELLPYSKDQDLIDIEQKIETSESLLERLKCYRDQRLAHHDSIITGDTRLLFGEMQELVGDIELIYNKLTTGHARNMCSFDFLAKEATRHTSDVVRLMREEKDRAAQRIKNADNNLIK